MKTIKMTQEEFDLLAYDQCEWYNGDVSESSIENWKAGYLYALREIREAMNDGLSASIRDYESLVKVAEEVRLYHRDFVILDVNGNFKRLGNGDIAIYGVPVDDILKEGETGVRCTELPEDKQKELREEIENNKKR